MGFLKKMFGSKEETAPERKEVRRPPRVSLTPLHRISFETAKNGSIQLANISIGGMGLICPGGCPWPVNSHVDGTLKIDGQDHQVKVVVKHTTQAFSGVQFEGSIGQLKKAIENYLRVEILALSLTKVDDAYLKPDPRGQAVWLTDGRQNEIYTVSDASGLAAWHLNFFGNYMEGERGKKVRSGSVQEHEEKNDPGHKGSAMVEIASAVPEEIARIGRTFVQNAEKLPAPLREAILKQMG